MHKISAKYILLVTTLCFPIVSSQKVIARCNPFNPSTCFPLHESYSTESGDSSGDSPAPQASTGWRVCNMSGQEFADVAYSIPDATGGHTIRGWRRIYKGQCSLMTTQLDTRWVYFYAKASGGGQWAGESSVAFCVPLVQFERYERQDQFAQNCPSSEQLQRFKSVDTENRGDWTTNLR